MKICAIMGASGSGKTSLLNVLAGRSTSGSGVTVSGNVFLGEERINPSAFRKQIAYVMQDDALMATSTPRELLIFSATMRLPSYYKKEQITNIVNECLINLGLTECADRMVGGAMIKGLSGGERKRTSIGVELVISPTLLFLDEPTSGLDSFNAYKIIALLKSIAIQHQTTVLMTIHQPSSKIFNLFDRVLYLHAGEVLYQGHPHEIVHYFDQFGYHCPRNYNPSDFVIALSQVLGRYQNQIEEEEGHHGDGGYDTQTMETIAHFMHPQQHVAASLSSSKHQQHHKMDGMDGIDGESDVVEVSEVILIPTNNDNNDKNNSNHSIESNSNSNNNNEKQKEKEMNTIIPITMMLQTCTDEKLLTLQLTTTHNNENVNENHVKLFHTTDRSLWPQIVILTHRETLHTLRDINTLKSRFGVTIVLFVLIGVIYYQAGNSDDSQISNFNTHVGVVAMNLMGSMMRSALPEMTTFPYERPLFLREYTSGMYAIFPYFFSKLIIESIISFFQALLQFVLIYFLVGLQGNFWYIVGISFAMGMAASSTAVLIGCMVKDVVMATEFVPVVFLPQILFLGFFIRMSEIPVFLRWAQYLCSLKYAMNLFLLTEFHPSNPSCADNPKTQKYCANLLITNEVKEEDWYIYLIVLLILLIGFRVIGAFFLMYHARKYY